MLHSSLFRINIGFLIAAACLLLLWSSSTQSAAVGSYNRQSAYGKREENGASQLEQHKRELQHLFDFLQRRDFDTRSADERDLNQEMDEDTSVDVKDRDYFASIGIGSNPWGRKKWYVPESINRLKTVRINSIGKCVVFTTLISQTICS